MKAVIIVVLALMVIGCSDPVHSEKKAKDIYVTTRTIVPKDRTRDFAAFVLSCAKNANPMSDEEGEDLVEQCEDTGRNIYGEETFMICVRTCHNLRPCHAATLKNEIEACQMKGWTKE